MRNVRGPQPEQAACKHGVVRPVNLAPVIPGSRIPRERHGLLAATEFELEHAFGDIDIGRSVLPHRS